MVTYQTTFILILILPKHQRFRFLVEINHEFYSKQNIFVPRLDSTQLATQINEFNQQIKPTYQVFSKYCASFVFASCAFVILIFLLGQDSLVTSYC